MGPIKDFYCNEAVFITGASGFIGKALVEKVLRTCSGVKTVYLLMRPKKGQTPDNRIKALTENMVGKIKKLVNKPLNCIFPVFREAKSRTT